jgi:hypothetical protein
LSSSSTIATDPDPTEMWFSSKRKSKSHQNHKHKKEIRNIEQVTPNISDINLKKIPVQKFKYHNNKREKSNQILMKFDLKRMPVQDL